MLCASSNANSSLTHGGNLLVFLCDILVDLLVIETRQRWSDAVLLSEFEVLSEVLVSTPPIGPDHVKFLVPSNLMEV